MSQVLRAALPAAPADVTARWARNSGRLLLLNKAPNGPPEGCSGQTHCCTYVVALS